MDQDELVLVADVDVDDGLRVLEIGVLVHLGHGRLAERLFGKAAYAESVVLGRLALDHAYNLVVLLGEDNLGLGDVGVSGSLSGNSAACAKQGHAYRCGH